MKIHWFVPHMSFADGKNAFKAPPFWYRYVGDSLEAYGHDYYLFPFNLIERFRRWRAWKNYEKQKKTYGF